MDYRDTSMTQAHLVGIIASQTERLEDMHVTNGDRLVLELEIQNWKNELNEIKRHSEDRFYK